MWTSVVFLRVKKKKQREKFLQIITLIDNVKYFIYVADETTCRETISIKYQYETKNIIIIHKP